jgi:hypothetical protein
MFFCLADSLVDDDFGAREAKRAAVYAGGWITPIIKLSVRNRYTHAIAVEAASPPYKRKS